MGDISNDFNRKEFECNPKECGCGYNKIDLRVVTMAQMIRDALGEPVRINSACRCAAHNKAVGGVPYSYHTQGLAADLSCASGSRKLFDVIKKLYEVGKLPALQYCKHYTTQKFVHIDIGGKRTHRLVG